MAGYRMIQRRPCHAVDIAHCRGRTPYRLRRHLAENMALGRRPMSATDARALGFFSDEIVLHDRDHMKGGLLNSDGTFEFANASTLTDHLWIGGDLETLDSTLADSQLNELVEAGVTDIIDVRLERNDAELVAGRHPELGYLWLGVDDAGQQMPDEWFE